MNQETIVNEQGLKMEPVHRVVITGTVSYTHLTLPTKA